MDCKQFRCINGKALVSIFPKKVTFCNFYSLQKVKIWVKKGQKGAMHFKHSTGAKIYLSEENILGLGAL